MKNTKIVPCGMARRYNEESGAWGECVELVNMRERNESLEVVGRWNELADVASGERILLADRRADAEYYFSAKGIKVNIHGMLKNGTYSVMNKTVCVTQGDVLWLKSIGDFVVIGTSAGNKYLRFNGGEYAELLRDELEPIIVFKAVNVCAITQKVAGRDFAKAYSRWVTLDEKDRLVLQEDVTSAYSALLATAKAKGGYVQPVAVRCAVRLCDDSYAWISAPVIVGVGLQAQSMTSALLNTAMSAYGESVMTVNMYNIGATIVKSPSAAWQPLIKSIDVLVSDELVPCVTGQISCRCESSTPEHFISYGLQQRERAVALAEVVNPDKWQVTGRFTDVGALPDSAIILRSALYSHSVTRNEVKSNVEDIAWNVSASAAEVLNGRLCMGGHRKLMRNPWQSALYWGGSTVAQACEVVVKVKLRTRNGEVVKINSEKYDRTPVALNALIAFPDARAEHLEIKMRSGGKISQWQGNLTGVDEQGIAYFVSSDTAENTFAAGISFSVESDSVFQDDNLPRLTISREGNPLVTGEWRMVGQGEIMGVVSAAKPIFSGVFGRYPLYVFSVDGVYAVAYKASGDYKDAQLISHRILGRQLALTASGEDVYFVSLQGELCCLSGKDVKVLDKTENVAQLQWVNAFGELLVRREDDSVEVYMPGGRRYRRDARLAHVFGDVHTALGQNSAGRLVNLNDETLQWLIVALETYPMALNDGALIAPMQFTANQVGSFAENAEIKLLGSDGTKCEWRELATISLADSCCRRIEKRIYSHPCRLVKLKLTGNAATGTVINDYALKYN